MLPFRNVFQRDRPLAPVAGDIGQHANGVPHLGVDSHSAEVIELISSLNIKQWKTLRVKDNDIRKMLFGANTTPPFSRKEL